MILLICWVECSFKKPIQILQALVPCVAYGVSSMEGSQSTWMTIARLSFIYTQIYQF